MVVGSGGGGWWVGVPSDHPTTVMVVGVVACWAVTIFVTDIIL